MRWGVDDDMHGGVTRAVVFCMCHQRANQKRATHTSTMVPATIIHKYTPTAINSDTIEVNSDQADDETRTFIHMLSRTNNLVGWALLAPAPASSSTAAASAGRSSSKATSARRSASESSSESSSASSEAHFCCICWYFCGVWGAVAGVYSRLPLITADRTG